MLERVESIHRDETIAAHKRSVERVIGFMKTHLEEPLNLDQLARVAAISKFHFERVFKGVTGTTPDDFLRCLRIQWAKELLLTSNASITNICMEVGYTSFGSFSKRFKAWVGVPPERFRLLPAKWDPIKFFSAAKRLVAMQNEALGPTLEGWIESSFEARGFIFLGAFTRGVPQGIPRSGTVILSPGAFRIMLPERSQFHLLAVLLPFSADATTFTTTLPATLVASQDVQLNDLWPPVRPRLSLRKPQLTDPPLLLAPSALLEEVTA